MIRILRRYPENCPEERYVVNQEMQLLNVFTDPHHLLQKLKKKSLRDDLHFFIAIVVAGYLIFVLLSTLMPSHHGIASDDSGLFLIGLPGMSIGLLRSLIDGAIFLLGVSLIEHFFLFFVDENKGFEITMKSVIYALSPCILFFWVAVAMNNTFVSLFLLFCFGLITYFGVRTFHEKSIDRAVFTSLATSAVLLMIFYRRIFGNGLFT